MSYIIGLDPGNEQSALVAFDGQCITDMRYGPNDEILCHLAALPILTAYPLVIEKIASYGMPVGETVFETVFWSGRFAQAYGMERVHRITRIQVKSHLCHSAKAKDGNIRQALIDRFGAPGTKTAPGALYGVTGDLWSALAVAVTWWDQNV